MDILSSTDLKRAGSAPLPAWFRPSRAARASLALLATLALLAALAACNSESGGSGTPDSGEDLAAADLAAESGAGSGDGDVSDGAVDAPAGEAGSQDSALDSAAADGPLADATAGSCAPQDAKGVGACDMLLGVTWDGFHCASLSGCSCSGKDCTKLYSGIGACEKARLNCICDAMDVKGAGGTGCGTLGVYWNGKACVDLVACSCTGSECKYLFKGTSAKAKCDAHHKRCTCKPLDAKGTAGCTKQLGYTWDGSTCVPLVGCSCVGSDCTLATGLTFTLCKKMFSHCGP